MRLLIKEWILLSKGSSAPAEIYPRVRPGSPSWGFHEEKGCKELKDGFEKGSAPLGGHGGAKGHVPMKDRLSWEQHSHGSR